MFPRFCVDFSFIFCRRLLGCLSIFGPYSDRILCVWSHVIEETSTSPLCPSRFIHPQVVPLIVSSHLLNVALIISWMNLTICSRTHTVTHDSIIISKLDFKKCLSVSWRACVDVSLGFVSIFGLFAVDVCLVVCPYWVHIGSVLGPYWVRILCVITGTSTSPPCASGVVHPQIVPRIVSSHLLNVPLIISWLNIMICDQTCTVSYNTIFILKLDFEKVLSVSYQCCVDVSSVLCRFFVY